MSFQGKGGGFGEIVMKFMKTREVLIMTWVMKNESMKDVRDDFASA